MPPASQTAVLRSAASAHPNPQSLALLKGKIEAILFAAEAPMDVNDLRTCVGEVAKEDIRLSLRVLAEECEGRAFFLFESGGRYQFRTRPEWADVISRQFAAKPRSLSKAAIETLAIVAYRQPITRAEINAIRGADSASIVTALKEKDLLAVAGIRKEVGNPLEFKTTPKFLEVFGLASLKEMPSLRSVQMKPDDRAEIQKSLQELDAQVASGEGVGSESNASNAVTEEDLALLPHPGVDQEPSSVL